MNIGIKGLLQAEFKVRTITSLFQEPEEALRLVANDLDALIDLYFVDSEDPYGQKWDPLKSRKGQPLIDTGILRVAFDTKVDGNSILFRNAMEYGSVHQYGTEFAGRNKDTVIPRRMFLPDEKVGLPKEWVAAIVDGFNELMP